MKKVSNQENEYRKISARMLLKSANLSPEKLEEVLNKLIKNNENKNSIEFLNNINNWLADNGHISNKYKDTFTKKDFDIFDKIVDSTIPEIEAEKWLNEGIESESYEKCDWCGRSPVTYSNEAHDLCENCSDQMFGI
ncbi:MAG: hypothetical protein H8E60_01785 [Candidatus Marinimicrobia bacterium]|nr:hypothetical protein [Candidatus Neomarinimicrobiota bacterium]